MGQIYMRDFKMVDQSDMIVSYVPQLPNGKPGLSSGLSANCTTRLREAKRSTSCGRARDPVAIHHRDGDTGVQEHE
jgi:hypothetical protein